MKTLFSRNSIVSIKIKSRKRASDISGRVDTGICHGIFRK